MLDPENIKKSYNPNSVVLQCAAIRGFLTDRGFYQSKHCIPIRVTKSQDVILWCRVSPLTHMLLHLEMKIGLNALVLRQYYRGSDYLKIIPQLYPNQGILEDVIL